MHGRRRRGDNTGVSVDPALTIPAAVIEEKVANATTLDDLPGIIKALTDRLQAVETENTQQDTRDVQQDERASQTTGLIAALQSQMLWICSGCILFGGAIGYVATKVVG